MVPFRTVLLAVASAIVVSADYWIKPETVPLQLRMAWCNSQIANCGPICLQTSVGAPNVNECDPETLRYGCVCSDGKQPNITQYTMTMPYFTCTEWGTQCVTACGNDNLCSDSCRADHPCGALDPPKGNATTTASTTSSTATASATPTNQVYSGLGDGSNSAAGSSTGSSGSSALRFGDSVGFAVLIGGLFAGIAMLA
ncbi:hypothetical protein N658DRAFT_513036 [Parathielavia hyrcaniae]|uniref:DUF7707 domain-containing protein n=1 Tax=Parathielavia hyrcaniae TaxID=113614 RepID=A0AAN6QEC7_9PEZI|nr:hypothetical protein N658DRAFT_513036 [Parathielavia hyrcaniae]